MATKVTNGLDLDSQKIVNVADPTSDQDAATKKFVDDHNWASTDITDFAEAVDDQVNTLIVAGTGITKTYNDSAGTLTLAASATTSPTIQIFPTSGTWDKPTGCRKIKVTCVGAGGGSGSAQTGTTAVSASGGGGAGATAIKFIDVSAISSVSVTIGTGGTGSTTNSSGGTGGTTSFGSYCSATGGVGSAVSNSGNTDINITAGGNGGVASNGDINIAGAKGQPGTVGWISSTERVAVGGAGGNSIFGGGGSGGFYESDDGEIAGNGGQSPGAGGGGVGSLSTQRRSGYSGANGIVIVEEYY